MNPTVKKVVKFGGSSLASAEQFKKVYGIIKAEESRRYVVPSAPGKRFKEDEKVTDLLIKCQASSAKGEDYTAILEKIKERYYSIISELGLELSLEGEFELIANKLKYGCSRDYMASRGEYLNGIILASYLGYEFIDAAKVVVFDVNGKFLAEETNKIMGAKLGTVEKAVIPGFYGSMPDGSIKTFSRGGSDITGAIVARAVNAELYENWTDVSGFLMCDPRIVDNPKPISVITYKELRELAYMGATVLHEDSIFPVKQAGIPINIKNTNAPADHGTLIVTDGDAHKSKDIITGIAGKKDLSIIHLEKDMMNAEVGFGMKVLKALCEMGISFEHLPSGIDTMSIVVNTSCIEGREKEVIAKISEAVSPDIIYVDNGISLIAIVGRGMKNALGTASRIFKAIASAEVNIKMIDQGSSELNIIIGVEEKDFEKSLKAIYKEFIG